MITGVLIIVGITILGGVAGVIVARWITMAFFSSAPTCKVGLDEEPVTEDSPPPTPEPPGKPKPKGGRVVNGRFVPSIVPVEKKIKKAEIEQKRQAKEEEQGQEIDNSNYTHRHTRGGDLSIPGTPDYDEDAEDARWQQLSAHRLVSAASEKANAAKAAASAKAKAAKKAAKTTKTFLLPSMSLFDDEPFEPPISAKEAAAKAAQQQKHDDEREAADRRRRQAEREEAARQAAERKRKRELEEDVEDVLGASAARLAAARRRAQEQVRKEEEITAMLESTRAISAKVAGHRQLGRQDSSGSGNGNRNVDKVGSSSSSSAGGLKERQAQMRAKLRETEQKYAPTSFEERQRRVRVGIRATQAAATFES